MTKAMPRRAWALGILFLLWNIVGIAAFVMQYGQDLDALAQHDPYQAELFATMPGWAWAAYALGVFAALLASLAFLIRSRWAVALYALSLIGILAQFGRTFLMTDVLAVKGLVGGGAFPAFIILVALVELWFARKQRRKGRLG